MPLLRNADVVVPGLQEHGPTRNGTYPPGFDRRIEDVTLDEMWEFNRAFYFSLYRASMLRAVGGWNPKMSLAALEDDDLHIDLMSRGARYVGCYETLAHYTTATDSMLQRAHRDGGYQKMVEEMRRHHEHKLVKKGPQTHSERLGVLGRLGRARDARPADRRRRLRWAPFS